MKIVVPVKLVPDLVEELTIDASGTTLDPSWLRLKLNEFDEHAIEQAILLKERGGGHVTVVAPDVEGADDALFAAAAKGADRLVKLAGDLGTDANNHTLARALAGVVKAMQPDLVLTGVQGHNDLDGSLGPLLASYLDLPYVGYVAGVTIKDGHAVARKEYPGGLIAEMEVSLPAALGIQAADQPPRYVAFSKIRQAMKTATIDEQTIAGQDATGSPLYSQGGGGPTVSRLLEPESGARATMVEGDVDEVATRLVEIFRQLGVL